MRYRHGTRPGNRLWAVKQAPYFDSGGGWTYDFDPNDIVFTPKMAKRTAPGPFAAAPIVQGKFDGSGTPDVLSFGRGSLISGHFFANWDSYQGSEVKWWTSEKSRDGSQSNNEYVWYVNANYFLRYEHDTELFRYRIGGQAKTKSHTVVASSTICIITRRNVTNKLDGTNYLCVSIDDNHSFGATSQPSATAPSANVYLGSSPTPAYPANAIVEGVTFYRRELWDGTYGVDAGNGDEINLIHASGAGKKPEEVTGADDICFQLPTDGSTGQLSTGTGEAWSWPWADNELTNWNLQVATSGAPDNWTANNAPVLADAETANILFGARSQKVSIDAATEGIYQDISVSAGDVYYISGWVKDGGANKAVRIRTWDVDGSAAVLDLVSADSSEWENLTGCFEVPAGCSTIRFFIRSLDADTYDFYIGQCQVLPNLVDNGGMEGTYDDEAGGGGGTINVAPKWDNYQCETDGTDTLDESADKHSGAKAQQINVNSGNEGIQTTNVVFGADTKWYQITAWIKGTTGNVNIRDNSGTIINKTISSPVASWTRYSWVRQGSGVSRNLRITAIDGAANFIVDDVSIIPLDDVSITVTPTSEANSAEGSGIRVDGLDTCEVNITGILGATSGKVRFNWTPRHGDGVFESFGVDAPLTIYLQNDASNFIYLRATTNDAIYLYINVAGSGLENDNWTADGITAGTTYLVEIEYNSTQVTVSFDGVTRITIAYTGGIDFGANIPDTAYIGTNQINTKQGDAVFSAPT